jgi:hypothetical protein
VVLLTGDAVDGQFEKISHIQIDEKLAWAVAYEPDAVVATVAGYGDTNHDLIVDERDLAIFADNWKQDSVQATWADGDFTGDGYIDETDLALLNANWRYVHRGSYTVVPEPMSGMMILLIGIAGLTSRR